MPRLDDDGSEVTLDLHGARIDEALRLAEQTLALAAQRGRRQVRLIHGASTSARTHRNRTIKHALHDALEDGRWSQWVGATWRGDGALLISLPLGGTPDPRRLTLLDL